MILNSGTPVTTWGSKSSGSCPFPLSKIRSLKACSTGVMRGLQPINMNSSKKRCSRKRPQKTFSSRCEILIFKSKPTQSTIIDLLAQKRFLLLQTFLYLPNLYLFFRQIDQTNPFSSSFSLQA